MKPHSAPQHPDSDAVRPRRARDGDDPNMPTVRSVARAGAIMETLAGAPRGLRLVELSQALGLHKTTVLRLLKTLIATRMVRRTPDDRYRWDPLRWLGTVSLAAQVSNYDRVLSLLGVLARTTGHAVGLCTADGPTRTVTIVAATPPPGGFDLGARVRTPLHACAAGKVFLAYLGERALERYLSSNLEAVTPYTLTDPDRLRSELEEARLRGCAVSRQEFLPGISALAVAVLDEEGDLAAELLLAGPQEAFTDADVAAWLPQMRTAAAQLSQELYP